MGGAYLSWSDLGGVNFLKLKLGDYKPEVLTFRDYKLRSNTNIIASILTYIT